MSIRVRLVLGFSMLLALMFSQALIAIDQVTRLTATSREVAGMAMNRVEQVTRINTALAELRSAELGYLLSTSPGEWSRYSADISSFWADIDVTIERYRQAINDTKRLADYEAFLLHIGYYRQVDRKLLELADRGEQSEAQSYFASSQRGFDKMLYHIHRLRTEEFEASQALSQMAIAAASRSRYLFALGVILVTIVEIGLGYYIFRSFSGGLSSLLEGTRRVTRGELSYRVPVAARDEFGELAHSFNTMVASLEASQQENLRLTQESLGMREKNIQLLRDSLSRAVRAQEEERKRVARELHDQAGQSLTALQFGLARLEREASSPQFKERVAGLRSLTVETMEEVRRLALDLRPSALDELGLVPALRGYIREFSHRIGVPIEFQVSGEERRLAPEAEIALVRVVQEGLTNIAKHSRAKHAWVTLTSSPQRLEVTIGDDGVGFDVEAFMHSPDRRSLGLFGIQERVELLGGSFSVQSRPRQGTTLYISVPLDAGLEKKERDGEDKGIAG